MGARRRAYVDDVAFLALPGELGEAYLQPLAVAEPPGSETMPGPDDTEKCWELVHEALAEDVRWLKDDDFLLLEYTTGDPDYTVYGQLTPKAGGFHLEVVSNQYLPADHSRARRRIPPAGWVAAAERRGTQLAQIPARSNQAAQDLLSGLRYSGTAAIRWSSAGNRPPFRWPTASKRSPMGDTASPARRSSIRSAGFGPRCGDAVRAVEQAISAFFSGVAVDIAPVGPGGLRDRPAWCPRGRRRCRRRTRRARQPVQ